jgi:hypothetical protein
MLTAISRLRHTIEQESPFSRCSQVMEFVECGLLSSPFDLLTKKVWIGFVLRTALYRSLWTAQANLRDQPDDLTRLEIE